MSIEGRIAIDVSFADSATSDGVQSLKKISLTDTTSYTTGKVAIVTGTCGTAAVNLDVFSLAYKNAAGDSVSLTPQRIMFSASGSSPVVAKAAISDDPYLISQNNEVCVSRWGDSSISVDVFVDAESGTASYTLVLYGT